MRLQHIYDASGVLVIISGKYRTAKSKCDVKCPLMAGSCLQPELFQSLFSALERCSALENPIYAFYKRLMDIKTIDYPGLLCE